MPASRPLLDTFPYEILEKIVFSIPTYEKKDLRNCALASKALIVPAQRSIFFNICLWKDSYAPALTYLFKRSPHLGTYVRELELTSHPRSTRGAENAAQLFRLMPSVRCLYLNRLDITTPWEVMKSSLEDFILPQLRSLKIWCVYDAPIWLVSSCRQLDELCLNDCPSVLDEASGVDLHQIDSLPLLYLRIADLGSELFDFLCRSATQLVTLDLPICDGRYNTVEDRSRMPLTRLPELMNPMANTLVCLKIDAWPTLHLHDRRISNHPFFIGRYPRLRYFGIRLGVGPDFAEEDDELLVEDLETQLAWLSSMLCEVPSSCPHPLGYIGIYLEWWWIPGQAEQPMEKTWGRLDSALEGDHSIRYPHLTELQFSPKTSDVANLEIHFPLVRERGVLIVNKDCSSWSLHQEFRMRLGELEPS